MDKEAENKQLEYISSQREAGFSDEMIKTSLLKAGWSEEDIDLGFSKISSQRLSDQKIELNHAEKKDQINEVNKNAQIPDEQKKQSFVKVLGFALLAVLVLASVSASLFYFLYHSETPLDKMSKEERIVNAFMSQKNIEAVTARTEIGLLIEEMFDFGLSIDSYFFSGDKFTDLLMSAVFNANLMFKEKGLTFETDTNGEIRLVDGAYYVHINKVPETPFSGDISFFEDKWINLDLLEILSEQELKYLDEQLSSIKKVDQKIYKEWINFFDFVQSNDFLKITELNKVKSNYTYKLMFDIKKLPVLLRDSADLSLEREYKDLFREMADEIERDWDEFEKMVVMEDGYTVPMIVEINKETGNLVGIYIDLEFKVITDSTTRSVFNVEDYLTVKFSFENTFSDFGKEKAVEKPNESVSFEEIISDSTFEQNESPQKQRALDAVIHSNLSRMREEAYIYSSSHQGYSGLCTADSIESGIKGLGDSVNDVAPSGTYECNDSVDEWAAWAQLKDSDDFYCVDHTWFSGVLSFKPTTGSTECPQENEEKDIKLPFNLSPLFLSSLKETKENFEINDSQNLLQALVSEIIKNK